MAAQGRHLVFRDRGDPPHPNNPAHDWAAAFGSSLDPTATRTGPGFRGPRARPVICPASGPNVPTQPKRCDHTAYGKGVGGQLTDRVRLRAGEVHLLGPADFVGALAADGPGRRSSDWRWASG